jgi:WD40 repeat protein
MYYKQAIESSPLQAYGSALLFSPKQSVVRKLFQHEGLEGISLTPGMSDGWSACLQTLEGHSSIVSSVAFSHDSTQLASASYDNTVKIWDASSGACLQTLEGHSSSVRSVAFSHDSKRLASASNDNTVKIWDASSGAFLQTLSVGKPLRSLLFDTTSSRLLTEIGAIDVGAFIGSGVGNVTVLQRPQYLDAGVSSDNTWITYNGKNLLWIPPEYRPSCSIVCGNMIGLGVGSGRVWICSINL